MTVLAIPGASPALELTLVLPMKTSVGVIIGNDIFCWALGCSMSEFGIDLAKYAGEVRRQRLKTSKFQANAFALVDTPDIVWQRDRVCNISGSWSRRLKSHVVRFDTY